MNTYQQQWRAYYAEYLSYMWRLWERDAVVGSSVTQEEFEDWVWEHSEHEKAMGASEMKAERVFAPESDDDSLCCAIFDKYLELRSYCEGAVVPLLTTTCAGAVAQLIALVTAAQDTYNTTSSSI